jgi:hypothetical protein
MEWALLDLSSASLGLVYDSRRPDVSGVVGIVALLALLWLMFFKPF